MNPTAIPGYDHRSATLARSPISLDDLQLLRTTLLFGDEDVAALRRAKDVLAPQVEQILDVWYGFVGDNPHLVAAFLDAEGKPDTDYLDAVRARFGQWIIDTCDATYDQAWLDWQHEVGLRHHRAKKNQTDHARAAADIVPFRYLLALTFPIFATVRPFLEKVGGTPADIDAMHHAWLKAVLLQVILWSRPYVADEDY